VASPSRHVCALTLLVALLPLAACGSDPQTDATDFGDTVAAKGGVDTTGAPKGHLLLPTGRLDVRAGKPIESLSADVTQERTERTAPDGGVFVPLTWTYLTTAMEKLEPVFGPTLPIDMTLVTDGESYPLTPPTPERDGERAEAYYVAVAGTGKKVSLEVEYAGVTQSLDLASGKRDPGAAKNIYSMDTSTYSEELKPCPSQTWIDEGPLAQAGFTCNRTNAVVVPFVDGEWAPEGTNFAVIGLTSTLASFAVHGVSGAGATYTVASGKDKSTLAGERSVKVLDQNGSAGFSAGILVFPLKGKLPASLDLHRTYQLVRSARVGNIDAPHARKLDVRGEIPLR